MNIEGVWKVEMLGPYGWEVVATAFLEAGRYREAGDSHFSVGRYEIDGGRLRVRAVTSIYREARTLFGKTSNHFAVEFEGELSDDKVIGEARDADAQFSLPFRGTRVGDLVE